MANPLAVELHASGAETTSGNGSAIDIGALRTALELVLDVTAASGTYATLVVLIETSRDGSTGWQSIGDLVKATDIGQAQVTVAGCSRYVRVRWTIGGDTPSFTFTLAGNAHVVYCDIKDIHQVAPDPAWEGLAKSDQAKACIDATAEADSHIRNGHTLPLVSWGHDVRKNAARLAAGMLLDARGRDASGADEVIDAAVEKATRWFERVGMGRVSPDLVDSTPEVEETAFYVASDPPRGW